MHKGKGRHERNGTRKPICKLVESKAARVLTFEEYRRRVRQHYDGPAGAVLKIGSISSLHEPLAGWMMRKRVFDLAGCRRILDVGTGAGQMLRHVLRYAEPEAEIYCLDISLPMLHRARARLRSDRPVAVVSDLTRIPYEDRRFDCVTCGWVLEHLPDPKPGLRELARVLQPGGKLLLFTTEDNMLGALVSRMWGCRTYNRSELCAECENVGLAWNRQLWFSPVHRLLRMGGILVEAIKLR